jgi:hypothetical protein
MTPFEPCPSCARHRRADAMVCPFCAADVRGRIRMPASKEASAASTRTSRVEGGTDRRRSCPRHRSPRCAAEPSGRVPCARLRRRGRPAIAPAMTGNARSWDPSGRRDDGSPASRGADGATGPGTCSPRAPRSGVARALGVLGHLAVATGAAAVASLDCGSSASVPLPGGVGFTQDGGGGGFADSGADGPAEAADATRSSDLGEPCSGADQCGDPTVEACCISATTAGPGRGPASSAARAAERRRSSAARRSLARTTEAARPSRARSPAYRSAPGASSAHDPTRAAHTTTRAARTTTRATRTTTHRSTALGTRPWMRTLRRTRRPSS